MYDDDDHITIGYYHFRGCGWFEMELYLPLLVDCPKNKMPAILSQLSLIHISEPTRPY